MTFLCKWQQPGIRLYIINKRTLKQTRIKQNKTKQSKENLKQSNQNLKQKEHERRKEIQSTSNKTITNVKVFSLLKRLLIGFKWSVPCRHADGI